MRPLTKDLCVVLACAFASGCVTRPVYDESWAGQVKVEPGACPDIDGVYQNAGEAFEPGKDGELTRHELSLAHLLNGGWDRASHRADNRLGTTTYQAAGDVYQTIALRRVEDKLHIEASRADGATRAIRLPLRHECRDSLMVLETDHGYDLFTASFVRGYYAFGRADDGSLLAYGSETGEMLAIFWSSKAFWVRFPQVTPTLPQEPAQLSAVSPQREGAPPEGLSENGIRSNLGKNEGGPQDRLRTSRARAADDVRGL